jgi:hypothetical protein
VNAGWVCDRNHRSTVNGKHARDVAENSKAKHIQRQHCGSTSAKPSLKGCHSIAIAAALNTTPMTALAILIGAAARLASPGAIAIGTIPVISAALFINIGFLCSRLPLDLDGGGPTMNAALRRSLVTRLKEGGLRIDAARETPAPPDAAAKLALRSGCSCGADRATERERCGAR